MDLNGDGLMDILSGSYYDKSEEERKPGPIYFFAAQRDGSYARPEKLRFTDGAPIQIRPASAAAFADWDQDGDLDLVLGFLTRQVHLLLNDGHMRFSQPLNMISGTQPIESHDGRPCVADWDGDGLDDLIIGQEAGEVLFYKALSVGANGVPAFAKPVTLIKELDQPFTEEVKVGTLQLVDDRSGRRAVPTVTDWNGDGKPDLLVGDATFILPPKRELTDEDRADIKRIEGLRDEVNERSSVIVKAAGKQIRSDMGLSESEDMSPSQSKQFRKLLKDTLESNPQFLKLKDEALRLYEEANQYNRVPKLHGFVWVYIQK